MFFFAQETITSNHRPAYSWFEKFSDGRGWRHFSAMVVSAAIRREIVIKENILLVDLQKNEDCEWQRPFYAVSGELVLISIL